MKLTRDYLTIPRRLIIELRDNPLALALYCWIARLSLIVQAPVPLSRSDVRMYDPATKEGAIKRAFDRLIDGGWLIETSGYKSSYVPVWGKRRGSSAPYPWSVGAEHLGCPRHIETIRIDRAILDVYMGRFRPHTRNPLTESYVSKPLIRLVDIGSYLLIAAGLPADDTQLLQQWGLVCDGAIQAIPDDAVIVALASQRATISGFQITEEGWRKLGWDARRTSRQRQEQHTTEAAPLIFVPKELIGALIPNLIGTLIGDSSLDQAGFSRSEGAETSVATAAPTITGTHGDSQESRESPPSPRRQPGAQHGGGILAAKDKKHRQQTELPDTEAAKLLSSIHVHPTSIIELATMPRELVEQTIAYATAEPGIAHIPGWVVDALRRHRDQGWPIPMLRSKHGGGCINVQEIMSGRYGDLFRLGSDLTALDDSLTDLEPGSADWQAAAQSATSHLAPIGTSTAIRDQEFVPDRSPPAENDQAGDLASAEAQLGERPAGATDRAILVRLWNRVLDHMQVRISRHEFNTWIRCLELCAIDQGVVTISAPSPLLKQGFENRYADLVRRLIRDLDTPVEQICVVVAGEVRQSRPGSLRDVCPVSIRDPTRSAIA